jgi:hypothetical protein
VKVHVLHENPEWFAPVGAALAAEGVPYEQWLLGDAVLDLGEPPPAGVFWSRMSASSHTRGHPHAKDQTRGVLSWLEAHSRRVVNGRPVLELEMSKVDQLVALRAAGFDVPRTIAVAGTVELAAAARKLPEPFIAKHNQGGKGLGVRLFATHEDFDAYLGSTDYEAPVDGITLLQEYLRADQPRITRAEVVGGEFIYAICADTAVGGFQLCPADACGCREATGPRRSCSRFARILIIRSPAATSSSPSSRESRSRDSSSSRPATAASSPTTSTRQRTTTRGSRRRRPGRRSARWLPT